MVRYAVVIERGAGNLSAFVPDLPGCVAAARERDELLVLIREAVALHVEALRQSGLPVPEPTSTAEYVEV